METISKLQQDLIQARKDYLPESHFFTDKYFDFFSKTNTTIVSFLGILNYFSGLDPFSKRILYFFLFLLLFLGLFISLYFAKTGHYLSNLNYDSIVALILDKDPQEKKLKKRLKYVEYGEHILEFIYAIFWIIAILSFIVLFIRN